MNKKAMIYSIGIVIITMIVLSTAFIYYFQNKADIPLGYSQYKIFQAHEQMQLDLLNVDLKAKLSLVDSLYSLANNSGFSNNSKCGSHFGVPLLSYKNEVDEYVYCLPNLEVELEKRFEREFQSKLKEEEKNNHKYFVQKLNNNFKISGFALKEKVIDFGSKDLEKRKISYKDSFTEEINYNFTIYDKIIPKFLDGLNEHCKNKENNKISDDLDNCVKEYLVIFNYAIGSRIKINEELMQNKEEHLYQQILNLEESNFKSCYYRVEQEFFSDRDQEFLSFHISTKEDYSTMRTLKEVKFGKELKSNFRFYLGKMHLNIILPENIGLTKYIFRDRGFELYITDPIQKVRTFGIDLFKCDLIQNKNICIISYDLYSQNYNFLYDRLCELENRKYTFYIEDEGIYPSKGNLTYRFSAYVLDAVSPEIESLEVKDKGFDEDIFLIKWDHSKSNDVSKYEIFLDDVLVKEIIPWKFVNVYGEIDWNYGTGIFKACKLEQDGKFRQCYYNFDEGKGLFNDDEIYFFRENNQFVYVLNLESTNVDIKENYNIKLMSHDSDGNYFIKEITKSYPKDTLPYAPIENYQIVPVTTVSDSYSLINYLESNFYLRGTVTTNYNLDGTISRKLPESYVLFHQRDLLATSNLNHYNRQEIKPVISLIPDPVILRSTTSLMSYSLLEDVNFLLIFKDDSLNNLDYLSVEELGYDLFTISPNVLE